MTNREEANKLASKIKGETVNADTTKGALEAISGKSAGSIAEALEDIVKGGIPGGGDVTVEELTVTENGTYTAEQGKAYSPVNVNVSGGGGGSWHNINDPTIPRVDEILGVSVSASIVAFRMELSNGYVKGAIMGGDGDGGMTVSACGMKIVDYWEQPADCFFDTGFDIGYTGMLDWNDIATAILNSYNSSTGGSDTFTSFEVYY